MNIVLTGLQGTELFVYLDDIVLYADTLEKHEAKFNVLMNRLKKSNLHLQLDKCGFLRREVAYLGHIIDKNGVRPDHKKIKSVQEFSKPKNEKNHKPLIRFQNSKDPYNFDVVHKAGKTNDNADALSWNPVESIIEDKNKKIFLNLKIKMIQKIIRMISRKTI